MKPVEIGAPKRDAADARRVATADTEEFDGSLPLIAEEGAGEGPVRRTPVGPVLAVWVSPVEPAAIGRVDEGGSMDDLQTE